MFAIWSALQLIWLISTACNIVVQQCPAALSLVDRFCNYINLENHTITCDYLTCDQKCWVVSSQNVQVNVSCHKNQQLNLKHGVEACKINLFLSKVK